MTESNFAERSGFPILDYALFATDHEQMETGAINILGVHNGTKVLSIDHQDGWTLVRERLYVSVFAEEGKHTLLLKHENSDWNHSIDFEIKPEHGEAFLQVIEQQFGVLVRDYPTMNVYSMLLDGRPLGKAYLVSTSL